MITDISMPIKMGNNIHSGDIEWNVLYFSRLMCTKKYKVIRSFSLSGFKIAQIMFAYGDGAYIEASALKDPKHNWTFSYAQDKKFILGFLLAAEPGEDGSRKGYLTTNVVWLRKELRGHGLGFRLYDLLIQAKKRVCSSTNIGIMAVNTWHRISKKYRVTLYNLKTKEEQLVVWNDKGIPLFNGIPIVKLKDDFCFCTTGKKV